MKKAVDKQKNIQRCQKTYTKKTLYLSLLFLLRINDNINIIIEIQNIENTSNEYTILFVILYYNDNIFILDYESYSK